MAPAAQSDVIRDDALFHAVARASRHVVSNTRFAAWLEFPAVSAEAGPSSKAVERIHVENLARGSTPACRLRCREPFEIDTACGRRRRRLPLGARRAVTRN